MVNEIKLFNPNSKPFGSLSNNYKYFMQIDGQRWSTVTNYIYSSLLPVPTFRVMLRNVKTSDIRLKFSEYYQEIVNTAVRRGLDVAL